MSFEPCQWNLPKPQIFQKSPKSTRRVTLRNEVGGECYAPCKLKIFLWFCAAAQRKIDFECPLGLEFIGFKRKPWLSKNLQVIIFALTQSISKGSRRFEDRSKKFGVQLKMLFFLAWGCALNLGLIFNKTCQSHKFFKNLQSLPGGPPWETKLEESASHHFCFDRNHFKRQPEIWRSM